MVVTLSLAESTRPSGCEAEGWVPRIEDCPMLLDLDLVGWGCPLATTAMPSLQLLRLCRGRQTKVRVQDHCVIHRGPEVMANVVAER